MPRIIAKENATQIYDCRLKRNCQEYVALFFFSFTFVKFGIRSIRANSFLILSLFLSLCDPVTYISRKYLARACHAFRTNASVHSAKFEGDKKARKDSFLRVVLEEKHGNVIASSILPRSVAPFAVHARSRSETEYCDTCRCALSSRTLCGY